MNGNIKAYDAMKAIAEKIRSEYSGSFRASVFVAEDPAHALELMCGVRPGGSSIVLFYNGDTIAGDEPLETLVTAHIRVGVIQNAGLARRDGDSVPPALEAADEIRSWLASREFDFLAGGMLGYQGMEPIATEAGQLLHGYALTFDALFASAIDQEN